MFAKSACWENSSLTTYMYGKEIVTELILLQNVHAYVFTYINMYRGCEAINFHN